MPLCLECGVDAAKAFMFLLLVGSESVERLLLTQLQLLQMTLDGHVLIVLLCLEGTDRGRELIDRLLLALEHRQCLIETSVEFGDRGALRPRQLRGDAVGVRAVALSAAAVEERGQEHDRCASGRHDCKRWRAGSDHRLGVHLQAWSSVWASSARLARARARNSRCA